LISKQPTFLVDAMLGNIAKKLRLLGYDSEYFSNINDDELILKAEKENRIIITKDESLSHQVQKKNLPMIQITKNEEMDQLVQIYKNLELAKSEISGMTARCTICNCQLHSIEKDLVTDKVPEGVLEQTDHFWICNDCNKIYWEGTHIKNLQKFVVGLNEKL